MHNFSHNKMRFLDGDKEIHYSFKDNEELFKYIMLANLKQTTVNIQLKIKDKVYFLTNNDLYF